MVFHGETEEEFETTYKFLEKIKFYKMHIFKYSPRKGTKAEVMENQVLGDIKEARSKKLLELSDRNENEFLDEYLGKNLEVLFEEKDGQYYKGHTSNYIMVKINFDKDMCNKIKEVKVIGKEKLTLIGELI